LAGYIIPFRGQYSTVLTLVFDEKITSTLADSSVIFAWHWHFVDYRYSM